MNTKSVFLLALCILTATADDVPFEGISFLTNRPQHMYSGKDFAGWHDYLYAASMHKTKQSHFATSFSASYTQSLQNGRIAETLVGSPTLFIAGSAVQDRLPNALVADYFGLSPSFESTVFLKPFIRTGIISADCAWSFYHSTHHFYIKTGLPFCITSWHLNVQEMVDSEMQPSAFPAGYMQNSATQSNPPAVSFIQAIQDQTSTTQLEPIIKGKMGHQRKVGLADIPLILGWQPIAQDNCILAVELVGSVPTGNTVRSNYLFEPIVGNGRQAALGLALTGSVKLWDGLEQRMDLYLTGILSHYFKATQYRSFDFKKNGFLSRYLLLKEFDNQVATGKIIPAINITTLECHVQNNVVFDGTFMFAYQHNNFYTDFGYNGFIKSRDRITLKDSIPENKYGIKGTQYIFTPATSNPDNSTASTIKITQGSLTDQTIFADSSTVFISIDDLNKDSAQVPLAISHTFFASMGYCKQESVDQKIVPFFGAGTEIAFEGVALDHFSSLTKHSIAQWTVYLKGGFNF